MNGFENYLLENDQSANDDLCLEKRVQEIKRQYENFMSKAFDKIEAAQTEQRDQQDARHKIIPEKLKIGTKVYLKAPGLLVKNKLDEAFFGPYTVHSVSSLGNYWLLNEFGELLKQSYPISKLKIVGESEEEVYEMEAIRAHRLIGKKREYFVKWKDYPEDRNSWVAEECFTDLDLCLDLHVDNELAKEKERAASYVKLEKTNLFSQKNNVSIATCVSNDINDLALNQEFENKFHHKSLVENFD